MTTPVTFDLDAANDLLAPLSAEKRLLWAKETFGDDLLLMSSMQRTASVLMHLFHRLGFDNEILFGDTGYHFHETLKLRDEYMRKFKLNIVTLYPELTIEEQEARFGKKLFSCNDGQPECCRLRKETPVVAYLKNRARPVVVNGLRRSEGGRRATLRPLAGDPRFGGYALSPLCDWASSDIDAYIAAHQPPLHPLHARSYPSIGCAPCTTPVGPGEDARAGRWRHLRTGATGDAHTYCGINFTDGGGI